MQPLLEVTNLETHYVSFGGARVIKAVDDVSFTLNEGETLGIVGESGCGKTTTCLSSCRWISPPVAKRRPRSGPPCSPGPTSNDGSRPARGRTECSSWTPRRQARSTTRLATPAGCARRSIRGRSLRQRVRQLLDAVRIPSPAQRMREYPHQMSGGMRQRIVGAIALAGGPRLIVADEPTTNLDVTIQAQYLDLLKELQQETGVAVIFVTHNLGIVARMCDKLAVMYAGKIVEAGAVRDLFNSPQHPYTKGLLGSMPKLGSKEKLFAIPGQPPDLASLPSGCAFHPRCTEAMPRCSIEEPGEIRVGGEWRARCWRAEPQTGQSAKGLDVAAAVGS